MRLAELRTPGAFALLPGHQRSARQHQALLWSSETTASRGAGLTASSDQDWIPVRPFLHLYASTFLTFI